MKNKHLNMLSRQWMVKRHKSPEHYLKSEDNWHLKGHSLSQSYIKIREFSKNGETAILVFSSALIHTRSELDLMGFSDLTLDDITAEGDLVGIDWTPPLEQ